LDAIKDGLRLKLWCRTRGALADRNERSSHGLRNAQCLRIEKAGGTANHGRPRNPFMAKLFKVRQIKPPNS
jgi:hypothetical protein